jgi:hypothetical protein
MNDKPSRIVSLRNESASPPGNPSDALLLEGTTGFRFSGPVQLDLAALGGCRSVTGHTA